jgi:hypothetical protein
VLTVGFEKAGLLQQHIPGEIPVVDKEIPQNAEYGNDHKQDR